MNLNLKINFKPNLTPQKLSLYSYMVIGIGALIVFSLTGLFLYKNVYKTIGQTDAIIILQKEVAISMIDMSKFNAIIEKIEEKTDERELDDLKDPFESN